jgi:hypothetical protein
MLPVSLDCPFLIVREYRKGNQKWTIQRNWQHNGNPEKLAT